MGMFLNYQNIANSYPNNLIESFPTLQTCSKLAPVEASRPYEEYNTKMITERNLSMADTAEEYLTRGGTGFFVVGAAHILGEGGCVELLTERGYAVDRVG